MKRKLIVGPILLLMLLVPIVSAAGAAGRPGAEQSSGQAGAGHPVVRYATHYDLSPRLRDIRPVPPRAGQLIQINQQEDELPNRVGGQPGDAVLQGGSVSSSTATVGANFEGIGNLDGVLPPDTNGDVGPNDYVQTVNLHYAVWDKSGNLKLGPVSINTLWSGFGSYCETSNDGDPVVQYDALADRWMISQFALPNYPFGDFYQCIAVSKTPDPTKEFYRYEFDISSNKLNDYPKFGVWPDAYYMSINQFKMPAGRWGGAGAVAFERNVMLTGGNARMIYFDLNSVDSNLGGMLPSDLDGQAPPSGAPNLFAQMDDDSYGYSPDQLQLWAFHVNWSNPNASTFTHQTSLGTAAFDSNMCNYNRNCIPQPSPGTAVDAISDRLMYRLQYRNFGDHQTLVVNHTVDTDGSDHAGVRWYELRNGGGGWDIYQQGTFAPDAENRWMGSAAMNGAGDIALGYSVSSGSTYPSIRFTGRLAGDTRGLMTQGEGTIVEGSGVQTHSSGRWGDYSSLSVDPADDCTFWYTQEYYATTGSAPWQTRIGSFKLADCAANPTPTPTDVGPSPTPTNTPLPPTPTDTAVPPTPTFTPEPPTATPTLESGTIHVGNLDGSSIRNGPTWQPVVTITILDNNLAPVSEASVAGDWSNGESGSGVCTTNTNGMCQVTGISIRNKYSPVTFTVSNVTKTGLTYKSADNTDPDVDSDGTTISVAR